jgi:hypothetical protein
MNTVFDLAVEPYREWLFAAIPLLFFLLGLKERFFSRQRRWPGWSLFFGIVTALLFIGLPAWDHWRMKTKLTHREDLQTVQGRISGYRKETIRSRQYGSVSKYRTSIWEEFSVGGRKFGFYRNAYPSSASFTNNQNPAVSFTNGMMTRITYVKDPAYNDDLRILKLEIGRDETPPDPGFEGFWQTFVNAAAKGDQKTVQSLTRFPFLFAGTPLSVDRFETVWQGLFPPPIRNCFKLARPLAEDGKHLTFCGAYIFVFSLETDGWRFSEFAADAEN